jgi:hypothetical protein
MPNLPSERRTAQLTRDAALRRVVRARTGLIVGSAGLTAGLAVFVADSAPGKTYKHTSASRPTVIREAALPPLASPGQLGLHPMHHATADTVSSSRPGSTATATQPTPTATQPTPTATQPTPTATQPAPIATQPAPAPPVATSAPAPVVSGGS